MSETEILRSLDERESCTLGLVAGVIDQVATQPILFWKNSFQQGIPFTVSPRVIYRGLFASCCNMACLTSMQFTFSGTCQKLLTGDASAKMSWGQEVACGFLGGAMSGPACCLLELIMIQQQRFGGTMYGTLGRVVKDQGPASLMRGLVGSTGREAVFTAGYLGSVPATRRWAKERGGLVTPEVDELLGTVTAGLVCGFLTQPCDTAKTCMQGDLERTRYKGFLQTLGQLHREYGSVKALYRGYLWRSLHIIIDFIVLDKVAQFLAPVVYPEKCRAR